MQQETDRPGQPGTAKTRLPAGLRPEDFAPGFPDTCGSCHPKNPAVLKELSDFLLKYMATQHAVGMIQQREVASDIIAQPDGLFSIIVYGADRLLRCTGESGFEWGLVPCEGGLIEVAPALYLPDSDRALIERIKKAMTAVLVCVDRSSIANLSEYRLDELYDKFYDAAQKLEVRISP